MNNNANKHSIEYRQNTAYLNRTGLQSLMEKAMGYPLVIVHAAAGYGKTYTVNSFLEKSDAIVSWMQISERDNLTMRFWEYFTHMISLSWPKIGSRLAEIGFPETNEAFKRFMTMLQEIISPSEKFVIVFDDFHLIYNPAIVDFIERMADSLPENAMIMLLSRTAPKINVSGDERSRVFTIEEDSLRFTKEEVAVYISQTARHITSSTIQTIYDDTNGLALAVNLIGQSLTKTVSYERYLASEMEGGITKLIENEIFQTISEPLRRFLLRISLIDHRASSLVNVLAREMLLIKEMELLNDHMRYDFCLDAYLINRLFLEYLQQKQHILTDKERYDTYQEAGAWCENNNFYTDALYYYEKSGDYDSVMRIIAHFRYPISQDVAKHTLMMIDRIPESVLFSNSLFPFIYMKLETGINRFDGLPVHMRECVKGYEIWSEYQAETTFSRGFSTIGRFYG